MEPSLCENIGSTPPIFSSLTCLLYPSGPCLPPPLQTGLDHSSPGARETSWPCPFLKTLPSSQFYYPALPTAFILAMVHLILHLAGTLFENFSSIFVPFSQLTLQFTPCGTGLPALQ